MLTFLFISRIYQTTTATVEISISRPPAAKKSSQAADRRINQSINQSFIIHKTS